MREHLRSAQAAGLEWPLSDGLDDSQLSALLFPEKPSTGEVTQAQIFVAILGASNYTYALAVSDQKLS